MSKPTRPHWDWRQTEPGKLALHGYPIEVRAQVDARGLPKYVLFVNGFEVSTALNTLAYAKGDGQRHAVEMAEIGSV